MNTKGLLHEGLFQFGWQQLSDQIEFHDRFVAAVHLCLEAEV
jgi:hypothetical protein